MGRRSYGLSELWVVEVMGRRSRDLTPMIIVREKSSKNEMNPSKK